MASKLTTSDYGGFGKKNELLNLNQDDVRLTCKRIAVLIIHLADVNKTTTKLLRENRDP